jgi:hypothetical protein
MPLKLMSNVTFGEFIERIKNPNIFCDTILRRLKKTDPTKTSQNLFFDTITT